MWSWLLRRLGRPQLPAVPALVRQSRDPDPVARQQAAGLLTECREPWAVAALIDLLGDTHTTVREAAAAGLRHLGPAAVPGLIQGLGHARHDIGRHAAELLGESGAAEAIEPLLLALKYNARQVQIEARRALVRIGRPAVAALEAARADSHPWVRQQVAEALAEIQGRTPPPAEATPIPERATA
jgi:HEAT repeat protein